MSKPSFKKQDNERGKSLGSYWPLAALILISTIAGMVLAGWPDAHLREWMHYFMGFFLCVFALLKLFHPSAFADGFEMYDLIAKRYSFYAYLYPFIELGLGLAYLGFWLPLLTYLLTLIIMTVSAIGVINALRQGLDINCPCMGSVLDVPLSTVTLIEDVGMGLMAAIMLIMMIV